MANSGDDQELQNETTVRLIASSLSEKAFVVVSAIVFGTTAENTYSIRPWLFGQSKNFFMLSFLQESPGRRKGRGLKRNVTKSATQVL